LTSSLAIPTRGSAGSPRVWTDIAGFSAVAVFDLALPASTGAESALGSDPSELISHGKFWYNAKPSLAVHLKISPEAAGATANAVTKTQRTFDTTDFSPNGAVQHARPDPLSTLSAFAFFSAT
jgi:hypothetical protein